MASQVPVSSVMSSETRPLLSLLSSPSVDSSSAPVKTLLAAITKCLLSSKHLCQLSKSAIAIILINVVVSAAYATVMNAFVFVGFVFNGVSTGIVILYSFVAAITLFSPLSGFLADVCYSRHRVILGSFWLQFAAFLLYAILAVLTLIFGLNIWVIDHHNGRVIALCLIISVAIAFTVFVFGLAGYQANFIQFGLDQLLEAPSRSLALFIHWVIWAQNLGTLLTQLFFAVVLCNFVSNRYYGPFCGLLIALMLLFLVVILCFRRRWFYVEPKLLNPYKMVAKVLNYARKHKHPVQRSAFTYCDDDLPSRIDFAKERYGGPFTTEQVENVKTFFRILLVLLALGPVFALEVPTSFFMFIVFGIHTGNHPSIVNQTCSGALIILQKGSLNNLVGVVLYPLYIWLVFSALRRHMPKIFVRLAFSIVLSLLGVLSMLSIDYAGHYKNSEGPSSGNSSMCMFFVDRKREEEPVLRLHWGVLVIPGILLGLGPPLVIATAFEFISAQSPFAMKGLLVGVFLSIRAFFQLVSGAALIPFSSKRLWNRQYQREHPPVANCGFGYFVTTCGIAFVGLVLFLTVAKRYKYRERDDRPYDQRFAVDVYGRYIEQAYNSYSGSGYYSNIP